MSDLIYVTAIVETCFNNVYHNTGLSRLTAEVTANQETIIIGFSFVA